MCRVLPRTSDSQALMASREWRTSTRVSDLSQTNSTRSWEPFSYPAQVFSSSPLWSKHQTGPWYEFDQLVPNPTRLSPAHFGSTNSDLDPTYWPKSNQICAHLPTFWAADPNLTLSNPDLTGKKKRRHNNAQKNNKLKKNYTCSSFLLDQFKPPLKQPTPDLALEVVDLPNSRICYRQESVMCHCGIYTSTFNRSLRVLSHSTCMSLSCMSQVYNMPLSTWPKHSELAHAILHWLRPNFIQASHFINLPPNVLSFKLKLSPEVWGVSKY